MEEMQKVKKPITKKWWFWVIVVIFAIGVFSNMGDDNTPATDKVSIEQTTNTVQKEKTQKAEVKEEPKEEVKKEKYELLEHKIVEGEFGNLSVVGKIKNNTGKKVSYVQVEINLYDKDNAQIGSTLSNVNNLEKDATWSFEAPVLEKNVDSYKIMDITGF